MPPDQLHEPQEGEQQQEVQLCGVRKPAASEDPEQVLSTPECPKKLVRGGNIPPQSVKYLDNVDISDIFQGDSNDTISSDNSDEPSDASDGSVYDTDDEIDSEPAPVVLNPIVGQTLAPRLPKRLEVNLNSNDQKTPILPLCIMLNARSVYNKPDHFKDLY